MISIAASDAAACFMFRAIEGVITSSKMRAFSHTRGGMDANDIGGDGGEESCVVAARNQIGPLASSVASNTEDSILTPGYPGSNGAGADVSGSRETTRGPCRVGHDGTEPCLGSAPLRTARTTSAVSPLFLGRCHREAELGEEHGANIDVDGVYVEDDCFAGGLPARPETLLTIPAGSSNGVIDDTDDDGVAAADWLEVAHALLDAS